MAVADEEENHGSRSVRFAYSMQTTVGRGQRPFLTAA
jgi:hypothetical protein